MLRALCLFCFFTSGCMNMEYVVRTPQRTFYNIAEIQIWDNSVMFVRAPNDKEAADDVKMVRMWIRGDYTVECFFR